MAEDVKISIKSTADTTGLEKTEKGLDKVKAKAKEASVASAGATSKMSAGFAGLGKGIERVTSIVGKFGAVFNGFGIIGVVTALIKLFTTLRDWLNKDKEEAEELARAIQDRNNEAAIARATERYRALGEEMRKANREQQLRIQLIAQEKSEKEGTEDAQLHYEEVKELNTIAYDDPDAAQKQTVIRNKYATQFAKLAATRAVNDRIAKQKGLYDSADQKEESADNIQKAIDSDATLADLPQQIRKAELEYLKLGKAEQKKRLPHLNKLKQQLEKARETAAAQYKEMEELRKSAGEDRAKAQSLFGAENAVLIKSKADVAALGKSTSDAQSLMADNQRKRAEAKAAEAAKKQAEEAKKAADAKALAEQSATDRNIIENGEFEVQEYQGRIDANLAAQDAAQAAHDKERREAFMAQSNLDNFNSANRGRKGSAINKQRAALTEELRREQEDVQSSEIELKKTMNSLTSSLQSLKKQLAEVNSKVNKAMNRQNAAADAEPAGE